MREEKGRQQSLIFTMTAANILKFSEIDPIQSAKNIKYQKTGRVLIVHGKADGQIPYQDAVAFYEALAISHKKLLLIENCSHHFKESFQLVLEEILHAILDTFE
jgi:fermentation-respiration switch protein FrsA (DUF1100 family)